MRRLFVIFAVLLIAGLAFAAGRFPAGRGPDALLLTDARPAETPETEQPVRVVYPPSNETIVPRPALQQVAVADAAPASADPAPERAALAEPAQTPSGGIQPNIDAVLRATARIDLNTASVAELDRVPGGGRIGRAIVRHRPYRSVEDLLRKHVLRQSVYDKIKDAVAAQ